MNNLNFYEDMYPRPEGAYLARLNLDGGFCPENCKWMTKSEFNSHLMYYRNAKLREKFDLNNQ